MRQGDAIGTEIEESQREERKLLEEKPSWGDFCSFLILFEVKLQVVSRGKRQERKKKKTHQRHQAVDVCLIPARGPAYSMLSFMPETGCQDHYTLGDANS